MIGWGTLQWTDGVVDLQVEDVRPVCLLPCLEKLQLTGNAVTMTVDYRTKILEMFGDRVDEVKKKDQQLKCS